MQTDKYPNPDISIMLGCVLDRMNDRIPQSLASLPTCGSVVYSIRSLRVWIGRLVVEESRSSRLMGDQLPMSYRTPPPVRSQQRRVEAPSAARREQVRLSVWRISVGHI